MAEKNTLRLVILCNKLYGVCMAQWSVVSPLVLEGVGVQVQIPVRQHTAFFFFHRIFITFACFPLFPLLTLFSFTRFLQ